jgi:hypothetical protein
MKIINNAEKIQAIHKLLTEANKLAAELKEPDMELKFQEKVGSCSRPNISGSLAGLKQSIQSALWALDSLS